MAASTWVRKLGLQNERNDTAQELYTLTIVVVSSSGRAARSQESGRLMTQGKLLEVNVRTRCLKATDWNCTIVRSHHLWSGCCAAFDVFAVRTAAYLRDRGFSKDPLPKDKENIGRSEKEDESYSRQRRSISEYDVQHSYLRVAYDTKGKGQFGLACCRMDHIIVLYSHSTAAALPEVIRTFQSAKSKALVSDGREA